MRSPQEMAGDPIRKRQLDTVAELLRDPMLSPEALQAIMTETVQSCIEAYSAQDFKNGDRSAYLNGVVEQRLIAPSR